MEENESYRRYKKAMKVLEILENEEIYEDINDKVFEWVDNAQKKEWEKMVENGEAVVLMKDGKSVK